MVTITQERVSELRFNEEFEVIEWDLEFLLMACHDAKELFDYISITLTTQYEEIFVNVVNTLVQRFSIAPTHIHEFALDLSQLMNE